MKTESPWLVHSICELTEISFRSATNTHKTAAATNKRKTMLYERKFVWQKNLLTELSANAQHRSVKKYKQINKEIKMKLAIEFMNKNFVQKMHAADKQKSSVALWKAKCTTDRLNWSLRIKCTQHAMIDRRKREQQIGVNEPNQF